MPNKNLISILNSRIQEHINKKYITFLFIALLIICSIELFSANPNRNFWNLLVCQYTNQITNISFFAIIIINDLLYVREFRNQIYIYNRIGEYKKIVLIDIMAIIKMSLIIFLSFTILNISFAFIKSQGNYVFINDTYYLMPELLYLFFFIVKYIIYALIVAIIVYLLYRIQNKIITYLFCTLLLLTITIIPNFDNKILDVISSPLTIISYLSRSPFIDFYTEVICSIANILLYIVICYLLYNNVCKRKSDV